MKNKLYSRFPNKICYEDRYFVISNISQKNTSRAYVIARNEIPIFINKKDMEANDRPIFNIINFNLSIINQLVYLLVDIWCIKIVFSFQLAHLNNLGLINIICVIF